MASFNVPISFLDMAIQNLNTFKFNFCNKHCCTCQFCYSTDEDDFCEFDSAIDTLDLLLIDYNLLD